MTGVLTSLAAFVRRWVRRLILTIVLAVVLLAATLAVFAFKAASEAYPNERRVPVAQKGALTGAYHVHTTASDGRGTVEEVAAAAREAGLAFVVFADHNAPAAAPRFADGVLLVFASELSTPHGHVVALGLQSDVTPEERRQQPLAAIQARGGVAVLSHPVQWKNPWRAWEPAPEVHGLELYSADTMLREALRAPFTRLLPAAGAYLANPTHALYSLVHEQPQAAARLLSLSAKAPKVALCSHDAHGLPPYDEVFRALALHLPLEEGEALPTDAKAASRWLLDRLAAGRALCVFRALGEAGGFRLEGVGQDRTFALGERVRVVPPRGAPDSVEVRVTGPARVVDRWTVVANAPGPLQIELWRRAPGRFFGSEWKPWVVPSPVLAR